MATPLTNLQPLFAGLPVDRPLIIAGPCSAETEEQLLDTATALPGAGVEILRAGLWKPRTKPGGFEGVGARGLPWMAAARKATGMRLATEVATRGHVLAALRAGIDMLWIGARTSANPFAVQEIADTLAERSADVAVLVKNPVSADLELWDGALQRLWGAGVRRLGAVHRGFATATPHLYRNMPQWDIPVRLRLRYPGLPLICDPSHIAGRRDLVAQVAQRALDLGFDGLMIESHRAPAEAWSDASQQLTPKALAEMLATLRPRSRKGGEQHRLDLLREEIDTIDHELLDILARRMAVSREIGDYKRAAGLRVVQPERYNNVIASRMAMGEAMGMSGEFLHKVLLAIHDESVRQQFE